MHGGHFHNYADINSHVRWWYCHTTNRRRPQECGRIPTNSPQKVEERMTTWRNAPTRASLTWSRSRSEKANALPAKANETEGSSIFSRCQRFGRLPWIKERLWKIAFAKKETQCTINSTISLAPGTLLLTMSSQQTPLLSPNQPSGARLVTFCIGRRFKREDNRSIPLWDPANDRGLTLVLSKILLG